MHRIGHGVRGHHARDARRDVRHARNAEDQPDGSDHPSQPRGAQLPLVGRLSGHHHRHHVVHRLRETLVPVLRELLVEPAQHRHHHHRQHQHAHHGPEQHLHVSIIHQAVPQTAERVRPVARHHDAEAAVQDRLREVHLGEALARHHGVADADLHLTLLHRRHQVVDVGVLPELRDHLQLDGRRLEDDHREALPLEDGIRFRERRLLVDAHTHDPGRRCGRNRGGRRRRDDSRRHCGRRLRGLLRLRHGSQRPRSHGAQEGDDGRAASMHEPFHAAHHIGDPSAAPPVSAAGQPRTPCDRSARRLAGS